MMLKNIVFISLFMVSMVVTAQVGVNTTTPDPSAIFEVFSDEQGVLLPRLDTIERDAIASPANGLLIYNTDTDEFNYNTGTPAVPIWESIDGTTSTVTIGQSVKYANTDITTNMNPDTPINLPVFGTELWNDNNTLYSINATNQEITIGEAGRYKIVVNVPLITASGRDRMAPEIRIHSNGSQIGTYSSTGYIRTNNGHQTSSLHITEVIELPAGAVVGIDIFRAGNNSTNATNIVTLREAGAASIYIERIL